MARVLLTVPYTVCDIRESLEATSPPLGVGYIASYLRDIGKHEVMIHDGLLQRSSNAGFRKLLEAFNPDIVGISGQTTPSIYDVYNAASTVKSFNTSTLVVVGGSHVTYEDEQVLRECPDIDAVVRGEGELTMNSLVETYTRTGGFEGVLGTTINTGGYIQRNQDMPFINDLDSLPFPAYDLLDLTQYFTSKDRIATMVTSRGCPYQCTFCSSSRIVGKRWRGRSSRNVLNEVKLLSDKYKVNEIAFLDDLFTFNRNRVQEICNGLTKSRSEIGWTCSSRADILSKSPEIANMLRSAGCHTLYIGAESGSQRVLNSMRKGITLNQVRRSVKIAKDAGLAVILSFVFGFPGETQSEMQSTIDFACNLDPSLAQFTICTPYPGTPLYYEANQNGWLDATDWEKFTVLDAVMDLPGMTRKTIKRQLHKAYLRFYMRPRARTLRKAIGRRFHQTTMDSKSRREFEHRTVSSLSYAVSLNELNIEYSKNKSVYSYE
ncbi:MAG: B12-binding domain-containing radical SAM protein [Candidatus Thorarchaeota archaeon]|jgi:radical SAM superfamily enzyme YgiQ (UPF0313 family)